MATEYRSEANDVGGTEPGNIVDPTGIEATAPEPAGKPRKPRSDAGKPRGPRAGSSKKAATSQIDLSGLAGVLAGFTVAIAEWRNVPEIGLDNDDASSLMNATQNVLRHYSIETTQKGIDWITLFSTAGSIAGFRFAAYNIRKRAEREDRQSQNGSNVLHMPGSFPGNVRQPQQQATPKPAPVTDPNLRPTVGPIDENSGF